MNKNNAFKFFNEKIAAEEKIKPSSERGHPACQRGNALKALSI
jgi:hypothetical protein